jgi:tellurite resistance protein
MAQVDGEFSPQEKELYRAILSRLSIDEHTQAEFQKLATSEETLLDAIAQNEDVEFRRNLIDVLSLMAIYDGKLTTEEQAFLVTVAKRLDISIDLDEIMQRAEEYRVVVKETLAQKGVGIAKSAASQATTTVHKGSGKIKDSVAKLRKGKIQPDNPE